MAYGDIIEYKGVRYQNITPNMTSENTPKPYRVTAGNYYGNWYPYRAFSDPPQKNEFWWWTSDISSNWVIFDYAIRTAIDMIIYETTELGYHEGGKVTILGSDDGVSFIVISGKLEVEAAAKTVSYCNTSVRRFYFIPSQLPKYRYYKFKTERASTNWFTTGYVRFYKSYYNIDQNYFLLQDVGGYKTISENILQMLTNQQISAGNFEQNGFTEINDIKAVWEQLESSFELLCYHPNSANYTVSVNHLPELQLIVPTGDIDLSAYSVIKKITLNTTGNTGTVKLALSFDSGVTWQTYANGWQNIALTTDALMTNGLTPAALSAITQNQWAAVKTDTLRVAYCLRKTDITDDLAVDSLSITGDTAAWVLAGDDDYTYSYSDTKTMQVQLLADGSYKINYMESK